MKSYILSFVMFLILMSCEEENPQSVALDPFVGSWKMINSDINLEVSFEVTQDGDELTFHNVNVQYPEITEALNYNIEALDRFAVNAGYSEIKIHGGGDQEWIILTMLHNRVHLKTRDTLDVYTMIVHTMNNEPIELSNQIFEKSL